MATQKTITIDTNEWNYIDKMGIGHKVTIDTNEWNYIDKMGIGHKVTDGQELTFEVDDVSASVVRYYLDQEQAITTVDGYTLYFRPRVDSGKIPNKIEALKDANDGVNEYDLGGEIDVECPVSGIIQHWKVCEFTVDDVDAPTSITRLVLEDQFGNRMVLPSTGSGMDVA